MPDEDDIIKEILYFLPEWKLKQVHNTSRPETAQAFIESPTAIQNANARKSVTKEEIIHAYHLALAYALIYLNRKTLPKTDPCYQGVYMWAAGLLEEKYKFKKIDDDEVHYQLNLVKKSKELLEPYILTYFTSLTYRPPRQKKSAILKYT